MLVVGNGRPKHRTTYESTSTRLYSSTCGAGVRVALPTYTVLWISATSLTLLWLAQESILPDLRL